MKHTRIINITFSNIYFIFFLLMGVFYASSHFFSFFIFYFIFILKIDQRPSHAFSSLDELGSSFGNSGLSEDNGSPYRSLSSFLFYFILFYYYLFIYLS